MTRVPLASSTPFPHDVDHPAHLLAGDERQRRLEGVGVPAHEDVGHADRRGFDPNPHLAGAGLGLVDLDQLQDVRRLAVLGDLPGPHHDSRRVRSDGGSALPTGM